MGEQSNRDESLIVVVNKNQVLLLVLFEKMRWGVCVRWDDDDDDDGMREREVYVMSIYIKKSQFDLNQGDGDVSTAVLGHDQTIALADRANDLLSDGHVLVVVLLPPLFLGAGRVHGPRL